ncbi:hypothetical protein GRI39_05725 [Altererythrobacter indicus]|uniref:Outer membrane assembly lipoprotein YfiO n=1 Tax=Altericroceibacterium indicum TaxID=374177 RepID=A0A845A5S7_9SPHN|nr:hypothetical protein [Altericroceibacterium indicum]
MRGKAIFGVAASAFLTTAPAFACADSTCSPNWSLALADLSCSSQITLSPGNDTRVNLLLLKQQMIGGTVPNASYPAEDHWSHFGHNFFTWDDLQSAYHIAAPSLSYSDMMEIPYYGTRCASFSAGAAAFQRALAANSSLGESERQTLSAARLGMESVCAGSRTTWESNADVNPTPNFAPSLVDVKSKTGKAFLSYLTGAAGFYSGEWGKALDAFQSLTDTSDPWLRETANYMVARTELGAALAPAFDKWGYFQGTDKTDHAAAERGEQALANYLSRYPQGTYAASAEGLMSRAYWLGGKQSELAQTYQQMFAKGAMDVSTVNLINEIDNKLLLDDNAQNAIKDPMLLAARDLYQMRNAEYSAAPPLTLEQIEQQKPIFAKQPELFDYLLASHEFYIGKNYANVLQRIPIDTATAAFTPLDFSRQILRGMAMNEMGASGTEQFWKGMLGRAQGLYQRPTVELGLALYYEKKGAVSQVFADASPITDAMVRRRLLTYSASAELLRQQASAKDANRVEHHFALWTLLYKDLAVGAYDAFLQDYKMMPNDLAKDGEFTLYESIYAPDAPLSVLVDGETSNNGWNCPGLIQTISTLAGNSRNISAKLCLGEFYRLNGFDHFSFGEEPLAGELGGFVPGYAANRQAIRGDIYSSVIADRNATRDERAYALYRGIWCYARSGYNSCGGKDVPESTRKAWFERLKGEYGNTVWARELKYYW